MPVFDTAVTVLPSMEQPPPSPARLLDMQPQHALTIVKLTALSSFPVLILSRIPLISFAVCQPNFAQLREAAGVSFNIPVKRTLVISSSVGFGFNSQ